MSRAMNGEQIYSNFNDGRGTEGLQALARAVVELQNTYGDRAQAIKDLQSEMESAWTGDAGSRARAGAGPLERALLSSADKMDVAVSSLKTQADTWHNAANSVEPVPPMPEKPSPWTTGLKAAIPIVGPGIVSDEQQAYQAGAEAHNRAAQHNVGVFAAYAAQTDMNSRVPRDYEVLQPGDAAISIGSTSPSSVSGDFSGGTDFTRGPAGAPVTSGGTMSGSVAGAVPTPGSPGPGVAPPTGPARGGTQSSNPTNAATATSPYPVGATGGDSTGQRQGRTGSGPVPGTMNRDAGGSSGGPRGGGSRGTGPGERAGSRLYGPGAGRAGAEGAGGRIAGEPARGAVKGTGAALPGASAAAGESAAAARSASGARGAGMAPMGAGAGRGKGGEDEEHQRPAFLQENDPDETFIGDLGTTTPPVIGE